jgi:hypothetical protein
MKTAVEWLEWQLGAYIKGNIDELTLDDYYFLVGIAKEMEKEQMLNAFQESRLTHPMIGFKHETFVEYYKQFKQ